MFLKTDGAGNLSFADGGITGLTTTATGTVMTLSDTANTTTQNLIVDNQKEVRWRETTANGTNYVGLKAPASLTVDTTFTLPSADGTSGQVLQTNGSGVLSFSSVASDFVKLATTTVSSNTASVSIDGYFNDTTYNYYILSIRGLRIDDNTGNYPNMRFNVGGSADTTASAYYTLQQQNFSQSSSNSVNVRNTFNNSFFQMNTTWSVAYQTYSQISANYEIKIYNPSSSSLYKWINFTSAFCNDDPNCMIMDNGIGMFRRTNVVTGITWLNEDGSNISAGTFTLYGVKK